MERYLYYFCDEDNRVLLESRVEEKMEEAQQQKTIGELALEFGFPITKCYDGRNFHMCRSCRKISIGIDEDVLCDKCAQYHQHTRFSKINNKGGIIGFNKGL